MKQPPFPPGTKQILLPLRRPDASQPALYANQRVTLSESPYVPFLPLGLFVWGATEASFVRVLVGNQHEANASLEPIPARYFSEGRSLSDLRYLADAGELSLSLEQRQLLEMEVADPGVKLSVELTGPFDSVCLWGLTYAQRGPLLTQRIVPAGYRRDGKPITGDTLGDVQGFHGQVIEHHLAGDRVISHVYAPSEQSVATLLLAARRPDRMY
jgi:hypothetical protein